MIHRRAGRKLKRTASHRKATLSALSTSLFKHKKIKTTLAKAKEARMIAEKIITRAKRAVAQELDGTAKNIHARREVIRFIPDKGIVKILFNEIAPKVMNRQGGYTRIVKLGQRLGDGAQMAILELVDYNISETSEKIVIKPKQDRRARVNMKKSQKEKPQEESTSKKTTE